MGLRFQEQAHRKLFATVIDERTQRVVADFRREDPSVKRRPSSVTSASLASGLQSLRSESAQTTDTAGVFEQMKRGQTPETLTTLEDVGVKEHWIIHPSELNVPFPPKILGRGGFGLVVEATFCHTPVAVKMFGSGATNDGAINPSCINELRFLRHLRHPNIVAFIGAQFGDHGSGAAPKIVLEKVEGKPLHKYLQLCGASCSSEAGPDDLQYREATKCVKTVVQGVIRAVVYLHSRKPPVVHSDLKPSNIVVVENIAMEPFPKLLDFGVTRAVTRHAVVYGGTDHYMAPEMEVDLLSHSVKARPPIDIYSLGRILSVSAVFGRCTETPDPGAAACTPLLEEWRSVIAACLSHDPLQRPTAQEAYAELFVTSSRPSLSQRLAPELIGSTAL
jgi:serine/threonine protein kinase